MRPFRSLLGQRRTVKGGFMRRSHKVIVWALLFLGWGGSDIRDLNIAIECVLCYFNKVIIESLEIDA